jgi:hypothetical protein
MDIYAQLAEKIISSQEAIIGPVAIEQAEQVPNLELDWPHHVVKIKGDAVGVIDNLVAVYKELFGQISVEVSKEAVASIVGRLQAHQLPETLK